MMLTQVRSQLAASAVPVRLVAGHNLYEEGDEADSFYVLQEGEGCSCSCSALGWLVLHCRAGLACGASGSVQLLAQGGLWKKIHSAVHTKWDAC